MNDSAGGDVNSQGEPSSALGALGSTLALHALFGTLNGERMSASEVADKAGLPEDEVQTYLSELCEADLASVDGNRTYGLTDLSRRMAEFMSGGDPNRLNRVKSMVARTNGDLDAGDAAPGSAAA